MRLLLRAKWRFKFASTLPLPYLHRHIQPDCESDVMSKDEALAFIKTMPRRGETVTTDGQSSYAHFLNEMRRAKELCPVEFEKRWNEPHND